MTPRVGIMACSLLAPELNTVADSEGWQDVAIIPLPCQCLAGPAPGPRLQPDPDLELHLVGCPCPQACLPPDTGITRHPLDNSFQLFLPADVIDQCLDEGAYLATPGWLADWRDHLARLGFPADGARELFREFARSVVLVDTGVGKGARQDCAEFAEHLGLPWRAIPAGLDRAARILRQIVTPEKNQGA